MPSIRVVVRFRPINSREKAEADASGWDPSELCPIECDEVPLLAFEERAPDDRHAYNVKCLTTGGRQDPKFTFDDIFVWCSQDAMFLTVGLPVVRDALNGINGTIFAYGQTGSGKTFSMFGPEPLTITDTALMGLIPRSCSFLLESLESDPTITKFAMTVSFFEIYIHNQIRDLLHPAARNDKKLRVRDGAHGVFIEGLRFDEVHNLRDILNCLETANGNRTVSFTNMNATSSRSHSVMTVNITIEKADGSKLKSRLNFGDLAGSEKVKKTGASNQTLEEAKAINKSLTMLGNVISKLAKMGGNTRSGAIPFRESALTHVLKDSLVGNTKTTLVIAASPHKFNVLETVSSFRFGSRCKLVKTKVIENKELSPAQMKKLIKELKAQIKDLTSELEGGGGGRRGGGSGWQFARNLGVLMNWSKTLAVDDDDAVETVKRELRAAVKGAIDSEIADVDAVPVTVDLAATDTGRQQAYVGFTPSPALPRETCAHLRNTLIQVVENSEHGPLAGASAEKLGMDISEEDIMQIAEEQRQQITEYEVALNQLGEQNQQLTEQLENQQDLVTEASETLHQRWRNKFDELRQLAFYDPENDVIPDQDRLVDEARVNLMKEFENWKVENDMLLHEWDTTKDVSKADDLAARLREDTSKLQMYTLLITEMEVDLARSKRTIGGEAGVAQQLQEELRDRDEQIRALTEKMEAYGEASKRASEAAKQMDKENLKLREHVVRTGTTPRGSRGSGKMASLRHLSSVGLDLDDSDDENFVDSVLAARAAETPLQRTHSRHASKINELDAIRRDVTHTVANLPSFQQRRKIAAPHEVVGKMEQQMDYLRRQSRALVGGDAALLQNLVGGGAKIGGFGAGASPGGTMDPGRSLWERYGVVNRDGFVDFPADLSKPIYEWSVEDVCQFLVTVEDGRLQKYLNKFKRNAVDGNLLTSLTKQELLRDYQMPHKHIRMLMDAIENEMSTAQEYEDDASEFSDDLAGNADEMVDEFNNEELHQLKELPEIKIDDDEFVDFKQILMNYQMFPRDIIIKAFSVLDKNHAGLVDSRDFQDLLQLARMRKSNSTEDESAILQDRRPILNEFVEYETIFRRYCDSNGGLTVAGAKEFLARLRECDIEDIRELDDGLLYLDGIRYDEFEALITRCPEPFWQHISEFDEFEGVRLEVERHSRGGIAFAKLFSILNRLGVEIEKDNLLQACRETRTPTTPTIEYDLFLRKLKRGVEGYAAELLRDNLFESGGRDMFGDDDYTITSQEEFADRGRLGHHNMPSSVPSELSSRPAVEAADPGRLQEVRKRLAIFASFGTGGRTGFAELSSNSFKSSSNMNTRTTDEDGCRLNQSRAEMGRASAWVADVTRPNPDNSHHIVVDGGGIRDIYAIALQGRGDEPQWVTRANVQTSSDGRSWEEIQNVAISCSDQHSVNVVPLMRSVKARFVKLVLRDWVGAPACRWDILWF